MKTPYTQIAIFLLFFTLFHSVSAQKLIFEKTDQGLLLKENDQPRFFYQTATKSLDDKYPRANYVHPLYGLDGEVLTEDFPEDHLHHRGIFWTWHQLYVNGKRIADPWFCEGITWEFSHTTTHINDDLATLKASVKWLSDSLAQKAVLEEKVIIHYKKLKKDAYALTFEITMKALVDGLELGGSEDAKGYGGFSPRLKLPENISFHSIDGEVTPHNLPVQAGPWMNMVGNFGQKTSGIIIMGEPDQLLSYQGWILRSARSMQNMAFPGSEPIEIPKGKSIRFRNQIVVHDGFDKGEIEALYREFHKSKGIQ